MPAEEGWSKFFDTSKILSKLSLMQDTVDVADFGCGYGTFTIPAARMIKGKVYASDIEPEMIKTVKRKAKQFHLTNVEAILRDFILEGSGLKNCSVDFIMLFNVLHVENPINLLREAYRILRFGGRVGVIHWNYDAATPAGPPMDIRPKPEQLKQWAESVNFRIEQHFDLKPYHYGLVLRK